jgi:hypothetical protein
LVFSCQVFRVALPHITLLLLSLSYVVLGSAVLTALDHGIAHYAGEQQAEEIRDAEHRLFEFVLRKYFIIIQLLKRSFAYH